MKALVTFFPFLLFLSSLTAQNSSIILGTLETNIIWSEQDRKNPFIVMANFEKVGAEWRIIKNEKNESLDIETYEPQINFHVFYNGKVIGKVNSIHDTSMLRIAFVDNSYRITNKPIPHVGKKHIKFSGEQYTKKYRPLVTSNFRYYHQHSKLKIRKHNKKDSLLILKYLSDKAIIENLGELPNYGKPVVGKINLVQAINDTTFFINANLNLNINCLLDTIPFYADSSYADLFRGSNTEYLSRTHTTPNAEFLVCGAKMIYIDYNTVLLDYGDYDNDGFDDFIFKFEKINYDGYLLVTDKLSKLLISGWSYN